MTQKFLLVVVGVLVTATTVGACAEDPTVFQEVPTTTPTTFDATKTTNPDGTPSSTNTTTTTAAAPGGTPSETPPDPTEGTVGDDSTPGDNGSTSEPVPGDDPATTNDVLQPNPPPTEDLYPGPSYDAPFDATKTTNPDGTPSSTNTTTTTAAAPGGTPSETPPDPTEGTVGDDSTPGDNGSTSEPVPGDDPATTNDVLQPNPPPTEDLYPGPSYDAPLEAINVYGDSTVVIAMPETATDVVGWEWSARSLDDGYDGSVKLVFDGWTVGHHQTEGSLSAQVTLFFTMVGDYTINTEGLGPLTLLPLSYQNNPDSVTAVYWEFVDRAAPSSGPGIPVAVEWLDPAIWAPVNPGEQRQVWMRWNVPINTDSIEVTIRKASYIVLPQDPGAWGDITARSTQKTRVPSVAKLVPFCGHKELCQKLGVDIDRAVLFFDGAPSRSGWEFVLIVQPVSNVSGLSPTDVTVWHEGQTDVYYPSSDPWSLPGEGTAQISVDVRMPTLPLPLYVKAVFANGTELTWGTVAPMRDVLFSNPQWVWKTSEHGWGELSALETADLVCWAHWTNKTDPLTAVSTSFLNYVDGQVFDVTEEMVGWLTQRLCDAR